MRLRTYLILSYVALIVILFVGGWFIDAHVMGNLTKSSISIADQAVSNVTAAHVQHSDDILTRMGAIRRQGQGRRRGPGTGLCLEREKAR